MMAETSGIALLDRLSGRHVPVLPPGAPRLLKSLADEDIDFKELARVIERFPTIAGRLIALANSAWSAPLSPIGSLEMACSRLGLGVVKSTSIALAVASPFDPNRCPAFDRVRFWTSAIMSADAGSMLAGLVGSSGAAEPSTARAAGLLHNLGLLWLADRLPGEVNEALSDAEEAPSGLLRRALIERLGFDSAQAGGHLGRAWGLPPPLVMAMAHYPESDFQGDNWRTSQLAGVAVALVSSVRQGVDHPVADPRLKRLGITAAAVERVGATLERQLERNRELAETLFGS